MTTCECTMNKHKYNWVVPHTPRRRLRQRTPVHNERVHIVDDWSMDMEHRHMPATSVSCSSSSTWRQAPRRLRRRWPVHNVCVHIVND